MAENDYVSKFEFEQWKFRQRQRMRARHEAAMPQPEPWKPREPVEMPRMELRGDDDDYVDIEDASYADVIFAAGINKYTVDLNLLDSEED